MPHLRRPRLRRKGTPFFRSHLSEEKAVSVLEHLDEGSGVRQTGRLVKVHPDTVTRRPAWPDSTPTTPTTSSWLFSPPTREVQFDEMWAFVAKKQENCDPTDPADDQKGDWWDYKAYDPEHRLVVCVVPGADRDAEAVVAEFKERLGDQPPRLITSDEHPAYATAIETVFGTPVGAGADAPSGTPADPSPRGKLREGVGLRDGPQGAGAEPCRGRPADAGAGGPGAVGQRIGAVGRSAIRSTRRSSSGITGRTGAATHGRPRKTYRFSKDWRVHEAMTFFTKCSYNFCWGGPDATQRKTEDGRWQRRTPAMAAGLADHVWSLREWLSFPAVQ